MSKFRGAGKWKPDGPARTSTGSILGKISAPIIADDDEFPIRLSGTGIASPLGEDSLKRELQLRSSTSSGQILQPDRIASPRASTSPQPSHDPPPPPPQDQPSALQYSAAGNASVSNDGKPHRKKSSLGSVFRKLFGTKKRKDISTSSGGAQGGFPVGQHRRDPTALNRNPKDTSPTQKRSASLPINGFNRALRSHSIDDALHNGINRESIQADGQIRPRRATTPSRLWTPNKTPGYADWTGLSPRPASTHGRDSRLISEAEAGAAVGIAVTSGSHPNRRSRSLGELRGGAPANITARRRSDEIKYWRESYDPGLLSPMSSNKAETEDPMQLDSLEVSYDVRQEQPQPFNFGPMGEMAGMKITQAASLETRVQRLEDRMLQLERAVSQMYRGTSGEPVVFQDPPRGDSKRDRSLSLNRPRTDNSEISLPTQPRYRELHPPCDSKPHGSQKRSSSYGSARPSTMSTQDSYHASFDNFSYSILLTSEEQPSANISRNAGRPLSTSTTIRGMRSSSPMMAKESHLTGEHYTVLTNMILAEQAARENVEAIVHTLQRQLEGFRSAGGAAYLTPDSNHLADPTNGRTGGDTSTFEQDESSDDEGRYSTDDFQTPSEEHGTFADSIFGDFSSGEMESTPRTLSLSQMTLRKGASVEF